MFELFFKYPLSAFEKGQLVFLGRWPVWSFWLLLLLAALGLGAALWGRRSARVAVIWFLQTATLALLLLMLWQPALSIATLQPQQNVVAVVIDDSRSMALVENGRARKDQAIAALRAGALAELSKKFQVRLYRAGGHLERVERLDDLKAEAPATRIGDAMKQIAAEASGLPIGAVVLMSDGADNAGGIDLATLNDVRRQRIPVHTVGFGREKLDRDVEIADADVPQRALTESRLSAQVSFTQQGYGGRKIRLTVKDGNKVLASQEVAAKADGVVQTESLVFNAGVAGARALAISAEPLAGEENLANNTVSRLVSVESARPRILYVEGEPKWEYKFIRRAAELDRSLELVSMVRTTQNQIYRQGIANPSELEQGYPAKVDELFGFQGLVIGGVEAGWFTAAQQELIRQFVDRRGGGVLFTAGRAGLADGGYGRTAFKDLLPVTLPDRKGTFRREPANVELTPVGRLSLLTRLEDNPDRNVERWKKLPYLADYQDAGAPKPGAVVLADALPTSKGRLPLLVAQNYGRGRTAVFATSGSWRWQMQQPIEDQTHEMFWQQMLRWLVSGTHGRVLASTPKSVFSDESKIPFRVEVRDKTYLPMNDAEVTANVLGPDGLAESVVLRPEPKSEGVYTGEWSAEKPGSYVTELIAKRGEEEIGRDVITFRREDGVAENFHVQQNRELLEKLARETGGRYYKPAEIGRLPAEITYSEAGISTRETRDLWNMPFFFLTALMLRSGEWLLRRKWGAV